MYSTENIHTHSNGITDLRDGDVAQLDIIVRCVGGVFVGYLGTATMVSVLQ